MVQEPLAQPPSGTFIVLGVPKGGTSVTAGILNHIGVAMGASLRPADDRNPRGFFEDLEINALNDEILAAAGGSAWSLPTLHAVRAAGPSFADRLADLTRRRAETSPIWGWKHTPFTVPLFLPFVDRPRFVLVSRDPVATARSAIDHQRGFLTLAQSLQHVGSNIACIATILDENPTIPVTTLSYEELMRRPGSTVRSFAMELGLTPTSSQLRKARRLIGSRSSLAHERKKLRR